MGAWIETPSHQTTDPNITKSRPTWARGLKPFLHGDVLCRKTSRPTWARGLKPAVTLLVNLGKLVAPHMGAWIETLRSIVRCICDNGRAPHGRVD